MRTEMMVKYTITDDDGHLLWQAYASPYDGLSFPLLPFLGRQHYRTEWVDVPYPVYEGWGHG